MKHWGYEMASVPGAGVKLGMNKATAKAAAFVIGGGLVAVWLVNQFAPVAKMTSKKKIPGVKG